ncbi:MAG TPA: hypothetical protein VF240_00545, partial [Pyrinomonadaceae bacterium]
KRPARSSSASTSAQPQPAMAQTPARPSVAASPAGIQAGAGGVSREEIAKIVDRFLTGREGAQGGQTSGGGAATMRPTDSPAPVQTGIDIEPQRVSPSGGAAPQPSAAPTAQTDGGNGSQQGAPSQYNAPPPPAQRPAASSPPAENGGKQPAASTNGKRAVDFVCEDDVRRAMQKGEKIYIGARTIITPAARDMGEGAEVFAKA